jgi:hypothetical protein
MSWAYWMSVGWRYFQLTALGALALGVPLALVLRGGAEGQTLLLGSVFAIVGVGLVGLVLAIRKSSAQSAVAAVLALEPGAGGAVAARGNRASLERLCSGSRRKYGYWAAEGLVLSVSGDELKVYCSIPSATPVLLKRLNISELSAVQASADVIELTDVTARQFHFRLMTDGSRVVMALRDRL